MTQAHLEEVKVDRYQQGWRKLAEVDGYAGEQVIESLEGIAPDLARYIIEFAFGDVYSRPELDLKSREIATIAALTAMGNAQPQLKVHIQGALNVGCTHEEVIEVIIQMAVYAGFPAALNGISVAKEVFAEHDCLRLATKSPTEIVQAYFAAFLSAIHRTKLIANNTVGAKHREVRMRFNQGWI